ANDALLTNANWAQLKLSEVQRQAATERTRDLIAYLEDPSLPTYCRLKTNGLHFEFQPTAWVARMLTTNSAVAPNVAGIPAVSTMWAATHRGRVARVTG